ncbi:MAG: hypothetical protein WD733_04325 [Bryobacterales bacterium]
MSYRLQVLIPEDLHSSVRKAAQRGGVSKGEWVRRAIDEALHRHSDESGASGDLVARLASLNAPTADVETMVRESEPAQL